MRIVLLAVLALMLTACFSPARSQQADSLLLKSDTLIQRLDSLLNAADSLSLFRLIDSLIQMPEAREHSRIALRLGYNSNITSTSRTVGMNQYGLSPGLSYFHRSGLYADASTYFSREYTPNFYLSVVSGGFMKVITKSWSFLMEYSRYFYSSSGQNTYIPYVNNLGTSQYFTFKPVTFKLDYLFYFGDKKAHRIMPSVMLNLEKRKWLKMDRVQFYPTLSVLFGSEKVITDYVFYNDYLQRYQQNQSLPPNAQLPLYYAVTENVAGVMNYAVVAPVSVTCRKSIFSLSYTYNIPKSLPHEDLGLRANGYLSFSVTRYFGL